MTKAQTRKRETGIGKRILALAKDGLTPYAISLVVERPVTQVRATLWRARHPEMVRKLNKACSEARYGTDEYRKANAKYVRERYHSDPDFRSARIAAVARCKAKRRAEARAS